MDNTEPRQALLPAPDIAVVQALNAGF